MRSRLGAGHRHDSRNRVPPRRCTADVQEGRPLANLAARESRDKTFLATRDSGNGQCPGNIPPGSPPGGWCHSHPPNRKYAAGSHWNEELSNNGRFEDWVLEEGGGEGGGGNGGGRHHDRSPS